LILATFPGWHEEDDSNGSLREVKPFPSRPLSRIALALLTLAALLVFVSVFWQHIASSGAVTMVQSLSYGALKGKLGVVAVVLGWCAVVLDAISAVGILIMILSINILAEALG
jgi:hypothetical protein